MALGHEVQVDVGVVGIELHRPLEHAKRLLRPTGVVQSQAQQRESGREIRVQLDCRPGLPDRRLVLAPPQVSQRHRVVRLRFGGVQRYRLPSQSKRGAKGLRGCCGPAVDVFQGVAESQRGIAGGKSGIQVDRLLEQRAGL
jgi:hypothetical protein